MLIRHADAARDAAACAAIYGPFVRETAVTMEEIVPDERELAARIERTSRTHPWLVADIDGRAIGFAYASPHRERAAYRWATDITVYVAAECRRRGVGRALYGALLPLLARQGFHVVCAGITLPNDASVALHEAVGFRRIATYRRIAFKAGAWRDTGWWQRELAMPAGGPPTEPGPPARLA